MKHISIFSGSIVSLASLLLVSCSKDAETSRANEQSDLSNSAMVQVFNGTVGSGGSLITVDSKTLNGSATSFGAAFPVTTYFAADPGLRGFVVKASSSSSTQAQLSFSESLMPGVRYNIFTYDTLTSPKQITVATTITVPADTTARVRLANFIYSTSATPGIDIFSKRANSNIFTNVLATEVTDFIPYASGLNDTLIVRETGTTNQLAQLNDFGASRKRSHTLVFRGSYKTTSGAAARGLSSFVNY